MPRPLPEDPSTADVVSMHRWPYPLAVLYRASRSSHRASARLARRFQLVEGVLRFLAWVNLAQAIPTAASDKQARAWLRKTKKAGAGTLLALLQETTAALAADDELLLVELPELLAPETEWLEAADALVAQRNRFTHDDFADLTDKEAKPVLEATDEPLARFVRGGQFLRRYVLGQVQGVRRLSRGDSFYWYPMRGQDESGEHLELRGERAPLSDQVYLVDPTSRRALCLLPFLRQDVATTDGQEHLMWLVRLEGDNLADFSPIYRHPARRVESRSPIPDPDGEVDATVSLSEYIERRRDWPSLFDLNLTEASAKRLMPREIPLEFDDRFELIGKLGEGGMGVVWEARDITLDERCALKILHPHCARHPTTVRRLLREARVLRKIEHPSVVQVHDVEIASGHQPFIRMDLVGAGETLQSRVERDGPIEPREAIDLISDVLDALQVVHGHDVVHRDIKPSNILLDGRGRPKLADFGIAFVTGGTRQTAHVAAMGTPGYMAPEQDRGQATPASDVFGAGRVLRFMLTGSAPPWEADNLSGPIGEVLERATAQDVDERYASAGDLREALRTALELADQAESVSRAPAGEVNLPPLPEQVLAEAERTFPLPVATALQVAGLSADRRSRAHALVRAVERLLEWTHALAVAAVLPDRAGADGERFSVDFIRPTLGQRLNAIRELGRRSHSPPWASRWVTASGGTGHWHTRRFIEARNLLFHGRATQPREMREMEALAAAVFQAATPLSGRRLLVASGGKAVEAMGPAPSGWDRELMDPDNAFGVFLKDGSDAWSLFPWVRVGDRPGELLLFTTFNADGDPVLQSTLDQRTVTLTGDDGDDLLVFFFPDEGNGGAG